MDKKPRKFNPNSANNRKGTRNRNSAYVKVALDKMGYNAIERYVETMEELPASERMEALKYLIRFLHPMLKETDHEVAKIAIMEEEFAEMKPAARMTDQELLDELNNEIPVRV